MLKVMKHAREQAGRHGSMFVTPDHLLLALLQTPCAVSKLLKGYNIEYEPFKRQFDAKVTIPLTNTLEASDVDLAPVTKVRC